MNREEAALVLAIELDLPVEAIQQKYNDLYNEYQIRLVNAPTPNLKKLYQKNLQELNQAYNLLIGKEEERKDLPVSKPFTSRPNIRDSSISTENLQEKKGIENISRVSKYEQKKRDPVLPLVLIAAICAIAAIVLGMLYFQERDKSVNLEAVAKENSLNKGIIQEFQAEFASGQLKILNAGSKPFFVSVISVYYRDKSGELKKFERAIQEWVKPRASSLPFEKIEGSKELWDGSVIFYSMELFYEGNNFLESGLWSQNIAKDKVHKIDLDNF